MWVSFLPVIALREPELEEKLKYNYKQAVGRRHKKADQLERYLLKIRDLMADGRFSDAGEQLDLMKSLEENPIKVEPELATRTNDLEITYQTKKSHFNAKIDVFKGTTISGCDFKQALLTLQQLEDEYSPSMDQLQDLGWELKKTIIRHCLDRAEKMENRENACRFLDRSILDYPDFLSVEIWAGEERARTLYQAYGDLLEKNMEHFLNDLKWARCLDLLAIRREYQKKRLMDGKSRLESVHATMAVYDRYACDLKARMDALNKIVDSLGSLVDPLGRLHGEKEKLDQRSREWEAVLIQQPEIDHQEVEASVKEISAHIDHKLQPIIAGDCGDYGNRARKNARGLLKRLKTMAENTPDWTLAMAYVRRIQKIAPGGNDFRADMEKYQKKLDEENQCYEAVRQLFQDGTLGKARVKLRPLVRFSAMKKKAGDLDERLVSQMKSAESKVDDLFHSMAHPHGMESHQLKKSLYLLDESELNTLKASLHQSMGLYRDSKGLLSDWKDFEKEFAARGVLDRLTLQFQKVGARDDKVSVNGMWQVVESVTNERRLAN